MEIHGEINLSVTVTRIGIADNMEILQQFLAIVKEQSQLSMLSQRHLSWTKIIIATLQRSS